MTPAEKWARLSHPQTVEDYGLGMTLEEIRDCPAAQQEIAPYLPMQYQSLLTKEMIT